MEDEREKSPDAPTASRTRLHNKPPSKYTTTDINLCEKVLHSLYVFKSKFVADKVSEHSKKYMT